MSDQSPPADAVAAGTHHDLGCQCWPHYGPEALLAPFGEVVGELKRIERELGIAQGAAAERPRVVTDVREHLREIVAANSAKGNDVVLRALLDAIRELSVDDLGLDGAS